MAFHLRNTHELEAYLMPFQVQKEHCMHNFGKNNLHLGALSRQAEVRFE